MRSALLLPLVLAACATPVPEDGATHDVTAFTVVHTTTAAVTPEVAYDAFTGDITTWWDHSFGTDPASLVIEAWPGGRFVETFRSGSADGVLHATVTRADRPSVLAFTGPLGFAQTGMHFDMVHTLTFKPYGDGTRLTMTVQGLGTVQPGWRELVERVWGHFLDERFVPFVEGRLED